MRCHRCRAPANVEIRRSRTAYCARCYPDWFRGQVQERIDHERMFRRDQRVLVAVSGGKDSLALWHTLTRQGYRADGMYIRLGIGDYSRRSQEKSEAFAGRHGLTLHQVDLRQDHGFVVPDLLDTRSGKPCAACGTVKRYHFNKVAADLGYDVVATGHNLDDEAATLFGNVVHWNTDYLGRQGPVLESTHPGLVRKVKPLYRLGERETAAYAIIERIDYILEECPMVPQAGPRRAADRGLRPGERPARVRALRAADHRRPVRLLPDGRPRARQGGREASTVRASAGPHRP